MKRYGNLYDKICEMSNLELAFTKAAQGKHWQRKVKNVEKDLDNTIKKDIQSFVDETQDINELSIDSDSEKLQRDSFTSSVLSYARKH